MCIYIPCGKSDYSITGMARICNKSGKQYSEYYVSIHCWSTGDDIMLISGYTDNHSLAMETIEYYTGA